ncbi:S6 family peptidase [Escherichia coli]|uniref:S6 family peptidase n=2 Tax=Escherichia coli TaxID=562 RepID=UPI000BE53EA2|nr:S6 family peptidase [Escherichia coli]
MNKIYSLKYCPATGGLIAVSELASRIIKKTELKLKISLIAAPALCLLYPAISEAGIVRSDISYQIYRDFAENKGLFVPGATDIPVYDKNGKLVGRLDKAPVIDFSSVSSNGVATLVSPQYIVSVKHNGGYQSVGFGNGKNSYSLVDRNNHPYVDFHAPRLNKLVTEVIPSAVTDEGTKSNAYKNTERYTAFYRIGSGTQYTKDKDGKLTSIAGGYAFKTGGTIGIPLISNTTIVSNPGQTYNPVNGPLPNYGAPGDSGSPLFAYDALQKKWVIVAVLRAYAGPNGATNWWDVIPTDYLNQVMLEDFDSPVNLASEQGPLNWTYDKTSGTGTLSQGNKNWVMHGQKGNDLNAGKNLVFSGDNGVIVLKDSVTQGAGYLEFKDSYTVSAESGKTWTGAGIITDKGAEVTWKVNGIAGDNLHKLGEGTLVMNGSGVNPGGLKTGDGTVVLNQQEDAAGNVQAFSSVNLASGRPTVVLGDARQVNPDNISWGYRGGTLDLNGNAVTFSRLLAADYGAVITNNAQQKSRLLLELKAMDTDVSVPVGNISPFGGSGTPGNLYSMTLNNQTRFYILKSSSYGNTLWGNSLNDPKQWEFVGTDKNKAIQTVKDRILAERAKQPVIFHGQLTGNMDVTIPQLPGGRKVIFDGSVNLPEGTLSQDSGTLVFQGHPVIHASVNGSAPVSVTQKDWENRGFTLKTLSLKNADFHLSRNATLNGDIQADNSHIALGSNKVFVDKNDGTGSYVSPVEGVSVPDTMNDRSQYQGNIRLNDNSILNIGSRFTGGIEAYNSSVSITSPDVQLSAPGIFANSSLRVHDGGHLTALNGLFSDGHIQAGKNGTVTLSGAPVKESANQYAPVLYLTNGYDLTGESAKLEITRGAHVSGDINASAPSVVTIGTGTSAELASGGSAASTFAGTLLKGYNAAFNGAISGSTANVIMQNALWTLGGDSVIHTLTARNSRISSESDRVFRILTVNTFDATGSDFVLRTDLKNADKISVTEKASGSDNTLNVSFMKNPTPGQSLNIPLVSAPAGTSGDIFKAGTRVTGFSRVTPTLRVDTTGGNTKWILDGFRTEADKAAAAKANSFMNAGYKSFMTEVNNLNKRMGELRDTNGDAGAWARIMSGAGSADGGYSDNYTHVQVGFDKKHALDGVDLFTGVTMTYTDSSADSDAFSGKTKSVGGGLYASALFNSGAYIDLIGKYIHHDNDYTGNFAGLGTKHYRTHSWYAGAETGYRYHLTEDTFIEPQAELVYGAVSGKTFRWKDGEMGLSMKNKDFSPLIGRTGIELGKTFSGKDWSVTARAGTSWQFDLLNNGETVLRDASGEKRIKGEKDSRMLFNVGMNAQIKDNMRFGLEFEESAFGKYNVDNAVNANFRYSF